MQKMEIDYAKELSIKLGIQLSIGNENNYNSIESLLNRVFNS
jgi:hypothetical protein